MANLPEPLRRRDLLLHPSLVKAAVSPAAVAATAVGAGIGALDHSVVVAVVLAAAGWCGRMAVAVVARSRRRERARPKPAELDPWSVPEPWRPLLQQASAAQTRFDRAVDDWPEGPIREHLEAVRPRLYAEMEALGVMARRGAAMTGWTGAPAPGAARSAHDLSEELRRSEAERARLAGSAPAREAQLARSEEAIAAQLRALRGAADAAAAVQDRLRLAVAKLDETITTVLSMGADASPAGSAESVTAALQDLSEEMAALRSGLGDASGSPPELPGP